MAYDQKTKDRSPGVKEPDMSRTYTAGEYINWTFEGLYELIRGKVFKMSPAPSADHQRVLAHTARIFLNYFKQGQPCEVFLAPFDVFLVKPGEDWKETGVVLEPDLCVICDPAKVREQGCVGSPDFVLEILSPSTSRKDQREKFEIYEEYRVPEYWMADPVNRSVTRNILHERGQYEIQRTSVEGEVISPVSFPALKVSVESIFNGVGKKASTE